MILGGKYLLLIYCTHHLAYSVLAVDLLFGGYSSCWEGKDWYSLGWVGEL